MGLLTEAQVRSLTRHWLSHLVAEGMFSTYLVAEFDLIFVPLRLRKQQDPFQLRMGLEVIHAHGLRDFITLMLTPEDFDMWLDPHLTNIDPLQHLLKTQIRQPLAVEPIRTLADLEPIGQGEEIEADE